MGSTRWKAFVILYLELYLCKLHTGRVSYNRPIWHLISSVSDELAVPNTKIMFPISPLREDSDG